MDVSALKIFIKKQIEEAKASGVLLSLHMKATMMKVSDPIIFGHVIRLFFSDVFDNYKTEFNEIGVNPNNGYENILDKLKKLDSQKRSEIEAAFNKALEDGPDLAMVNSEKGITNLHVPSDVIIDASMPAMIRTSGKMYNAKGLEQDTKAIIPDSSYASIYTATIDFCKKHGAFNPSTMGTVPNVGLMAQKAEEYGSHDKTFEIDSDGVVEVIDQDGTIYTSHKVEKGDIWRMCQVKDAPIQDSYICHLNKTSYGQKPCHCRVACKGQNN
jgi:isocitrate dehydrogenase